MRKYSVFAVAREALRGHKGWDAQWASPEPRKDYDVIIIGGGGHGLGAAYYLAKEHGITNVAVLEKGWLGGGNTGRNTTIIRSNYLYEESMDIYEHSLKLWEGLSQDLNYNVMYSARGVMMLSHNIHDRQSFSRHINANRLYGIDNEWLTPEQAKAYCPPLDISGNARYPINGAALQRRGGTARHDAVAWGYARAASDRGVHIIQNCEVTGIRRGPDGAVTGVETNRGFIGAKKIGEALPPLMRAMREAGRAVVWTIDPMHGNTTMSGKRKVRRLPDILAEIDAFFAIARAEGVHGGGIHLEMSALDVTECIGGRGPASIDELDKNWLTACDPRLNAKQATDLAAHVAGLFA